MLEKEQLYVQQCVSPWFVFMIGNEIFSLYLKLAHFSLHYTSFLFVFIFLSWPTCLQGSAVWPWEVEVPLFCGQIPSHTQILPKKREITLASSAGLKDSLPCNYYLLGTVDWCILWLDRIITPKTSRNSCIRWTMGIRNVFLLYPFILLFLCLMANHSDSWAFLVNRCLPLTLVSLFQTVAFAFATPIMNAILRNSMFLVLQLPHLTSTSRTFISPKVILYHTSTLTPLALLRLFLWWKFPSRFI